MLIILLKEQVAPSYGKRNSWHYLIQKFLQESLHNGSHDLYPKPHR
jgi:hypothetical protein